MKTGPPPSPPPPPPSPPPPPPPPAPRSGSSAGRVALLLALLALVGVVALGWLGWQQRAEVDAQLGAALSPAAQLDALQSRLGDLETAIAALDDDDTADLVAGQLATLTGRLQALESSRADWQSFEREPRTWQRSVQAVLEQTQARLAGAEAALDTLRTRNTNSAAELDLAELDYVLRLAQERLRLFHDFRAADQALEIAGRHLQSFDNPVYAGLNAEISAARRALSEAEQADQTAVFRILEEVQAALPGLPFHGDAPLSADVEPATGGTRWWDRVRGTLASLVTVRRDGERDGAALALADQELIRQRAWLEAETARLAVLRRDQAIYDEAIRRLSGFLQHGFDSDSKAVRQARERVRMLEEQQVDPPLPDISGPWVALQSLRAAGGSRTGATSRPAGEPAVRASAAPSEPAPSTEAPRPANRAESASGIDPTEPVDQSEPSEPAPANTPSETAEPGRQARPSEGRDA